MNARAVLLVLLIYSGITPAGCSLARFAQSGPTGFSHADCVPSPTADTITVYVANLGWHTGLVLPSDQSRAVLEHSIEEVVQFPWVEFGWGDRDFYMSSGYSAWKGLRALLFSRGAALHAVGFRETPRDFFRTAQIVEVRVSREGFERLVNRVATIVEPDPSGRLEPLGPSLYGEGHFYAAQGDFSLMYTCNSWIADLLSEAGCPVRKGRIRASSVMRDLAEADSHN